MDGGCYTTKGAFKNKGLSRNYARFTQCRNMFWI